MGRSIRPFGAVRCAIVLTALFCLAGERQAVAGGHVKFEFPMETYTQKVEIVFKSEAAAGKASVAVLPLYEGSEWAVTSRWDDNTHQPNLNMRDLFVKHGCKPTFYLTKGRGIGAKELKELLKGGGSLAGHSLTHPWLPRQSHNRIFEELAGIRIHLEAASDSPVCSFGFSFLAFGSSIYGPAWHAEVTRALERAGYYHLAEKNYHNRQRTDMLLSPFLPSDGGDIEGEVQKRLDGRSWLKQPNLTFAMHAPAFEKPRNRAKLSGWLAKYGRRPEWWYCNQNEYAAYRYQYRYSKVTRPVARGKILTFSLTRPVVRDLNDPVPLSFEVGGVPRAVVIEARSPDANCEPGGRPGNSYVFHLHHDRDSLRFEILHYKLGYLVGKTFLNLQAMSKTIHNTSELTNTQYLAGREIRNVG